MEINVGKGVIVAEGVKVNVDVGTGVAVSEGITGSVGGKFSSDRLTTRLHEGSRDTAIAIKTNGRKYFLIRMATSILE